MSRLTLVVEGPEMVIDLTARALDDSRTVSVCPDAIFPGYVLKVVASEVSE